MRYTLKDYQSDAVGDVLTNLASARELFHSVNSRVTSLALAATTGAGKTVMAAAVIESLFFGSDDADFLSDPSAVVLWFSDDPSLNAQTRFRLEEASDKLRSRLVTIEHPFRYRELQPGYVYFLNTSKLAKNSLLTRTNSEQNQLDGIRSHPDAIPFTIWDTIRNTIDNGSTTLYMVLDEAHRGMGRRSSADKPSIVKQLINGRGSVPPMPVVWGISATVDRFEQAMVSAEVASNRIPLATITVDPVRIQESGLLKDDIVLDFPAETGDFSTVLLRRGTRKIKASTAAWEEYSQQQGGDDRVTPLMVLQVPNKPDATQMKQALDVIFDEWPDLTGDAIANVFGDHANERYGPYTVPYIPPERVQDARHIRVVLAKDAISTGWDCPRAEVLVSFRPAKDATHITQLLGRMVRTPLARRVEGNDVLNSVECILPRFDRKTATQVLEQLMGGNELISQDDTRRILVDPALMTPNPDLSAKVWELLDELPSQTLPRKNANPMKRLTALAHALSADRLRAAAGDEAHSELHGVLDGLAARYAQDLQKATTEILTVRGGSVRGAAQYGMRIESTFTEVADDRAIQNAYAQGARVLSPDLARTYVDRLAPENDADDDEIREAFVRVAALGTLAPVRQALEDEADKLVKQWLTEYRVAIKSLPEARQTVYADITSMSSSPQIIPIARPLNRQEETKRRTLDGDVVLERRSRHLLADEERLFPIGSLNPIEVEVLDIELARTDTIAWYRNPSRGRDSLGIAYTDKFGDWRTLRPDFLFFTEQPGGVRINLVDPHGHWLPDALPKLRGMAQYVHEHGDKVHRAETISRIEGKLRVLDLTLEAVRSAALTSTDADELYRAAGHNYE
ncbi:type III restriction endonuclease subunit R [Frigoribacterium sp. Leaf263]|uniref:DEAD/DEAH box helicase n=1 Tax=Frigoribacterium sp. Leaf263 TaxID=1736313 RepID=UPI0006F4E7F2|nr:DEAD/DEAH box helicase family protein [Frigoribacterium sp. Leaf263]KQO80386.1 type III restriction endonuclease subunit R [Frigoribacterium sp. Leaf263]